MPLEDNRFYTLPELCELLSLSRGSVLKMLYDGRLSGARAGKHWRVLRSDIRAGYEKLKGLRKGENA